MIIMRTLKKKLSVGNVSNLLSDKQLKATIGGSGGISGCSTDYPFGCMFGGSNCWEYDESYNVFWGICKPVSSSECECRPI